jgi:membrane-associated protein
MPLLHINLEALLLWGGYTGLFCVIFAESGLFFGFFLPGDSLLFTAGLLAGEHFFNLYVLLILLPLAAIFGDNAGYWFGALVGPKLFTKEDSFFFDKRHIARSETFYKKYGPRALVLARFIPAVRTFVPIVAGVGSMRYKTFIAYNITGGLLWGLLLPLVGYFLGRTFPAVQNYLTPIIILIILISLIPLAREWWMQRKS